MNKSTMKKQISWSRISIRMLLNKNFLPPSQSLVILLHANLKVIQMVQVEVLHTFNSKKLKMQTKQLKKWMEPNWKDRSYPLQDMKRKKQEVDFNPSTIICLLAIYPLEQMKLSCNHYSQNSERSNQYLYRKMTRVFLKNQDSSASKILKLLKKPLKKWIKNKLDPANS